MNCAGFQRGTELGSGTKIKEANSSAAGRLSYGIDYKCRRPNFPMTS